MSNNQRKRAERLAPAVRAAEILDAARAIALEGGLNAVTLRSVATRVGVTPALIAHYEPSMDALLATTFTSIVQSELAEVIERLAHEPTPTDALRRLINTLLEPERQETTAIWVDAWSLGRRNDVISDAVRVQMDAWQDFVVAIVQAGIDSGEFTTNEPDAVAWQLIGMIDGLNAQSLVRYRDAQSRSRLLTHAMEQGLGMTT
ncbi:MAG TPA: TetR family transcriptional regulator C-terminal domain-containing protein, partial [Homoserinimonas sp.]|nr:TetR family transcriptional regulator C-terminal domain-containing protein [Homoserinimonas sp.]